jgi:hypothetical protein
MGSRHNVRLAGPEHTFKISVQICEGGCVWASAIFGPPPPPLGPERVRAGPVPTMADPLTVATTRVGPPSVEA